MHLSLLLDMAVTGHGERVAVGPHDSGITYADLAARAARGADVVRRAGATHLVFVAETGLAFPVALFASAHAGVPFVPISYRLADEQIRDRLARLDAPLVVTEQAERAAVGGSTSGAPVLTVEEWLAATETSEPPPGAPDTDPDAIAVLLFTSGTTAAPKAAVLRHRHLASYVLTTVEFGSAAPDDATLVSVPPYHIAGVSNVLSNVYAGRRIVPLARFSPEEWLETARRERVTHAMVVPTMLARIVDALGDAPDAGVPSLRSLSYGGARMPVPVLERALALFGGVDFVNAYGLTETSSTIAVLGPDDHRTAMASEDPAVRARLGSAGRPVPGIEVEIRDADGRPVPAGTTGALYVRGAQVSGEYVDAEGGIDDDGWFATRDLARLDPDGYLFLEGRADDTIIRGGENVAPAEIEDVLHRHPAVADVAVVGPPDDEWGQRIAAVVVRREGADVSADELRQWVRTRLRSSKTPDQIEFRDALPHTDTGKVLRRQVLTDLERSP